MPEFVFDEGFCPRYHSAVELIGKRWTGVVLRALLTGKSGYTELRDAVPGLSDTLLSARLKELQAAGIIERHVDPGPPLRVSYALTVKGRDLNAAVWALAQWAEEWLPPVPEVAAPRASSRAVSTHR